MKKQKLPSPLRLLVAISETNKSKKVLEILKYAGEENSFVTLGFGTAESEIASLFGFGVLERDIVFSIIKAKNEECLIEKISKEMDFRADNKKGLVFTVDLASIEKEFFNFINQGV